MDLNKCYNVDVREGLRLLNDYNNPNTLNALTEEKEKHILRKKV